MTDAGKGLVAMIGACVIWGLSPLFYKQLSHVPALDVLAHRAVWSFVFFMGVLAVQRRLSELRQAVRSVRTFGTVVLAAVMISCNWYLFIWAVLNGRATESSLGYYIYPLLAVLVGRVVFQERLTRAQVVAVALATLAVSLLTFGLGAAPWIALMLATTFAMYGMIKKRLDMGPVVSVTCEVTVILPLALLALWYSDHDRVAGFGVDPTTTALLVLAGPITAMPLILFSYAARRLRMATVGLMQYINPTLQFGCAVLIFAEPFGPWHMAAFALIWSALAIYSTSALRQDSARRKAATAASVSGTAV